MAATAARSQAPIERRFRFGERGTTLRTEAIGGVSTFMTMSYILFVNPAILGAAKVPVAGVAVATALAAAIASAGMGLLAGVPLTFSISAGIGLGVIGYAIVMAVTGRARAVHPVMWVLVPLFVAYFADDRLSAHVF
jgi:xanthine/uracil/vitamin C permease (AzgA family)